MFGPPRLCQMFRSLPRPGLRKQIFAWLSRSKTLSVFHRVNERFHHLSIYKITIELIQLRQPEIVASIIRIRRVVRVPAQITKELHQYKRAVEFLSVERGVLGYASQGLSSGRRVAGVRR